MQTEQRLDIPLLILKNLVQNEDYHRAVTPHLKKEYFGNDLAKQTLIEEILKFSSTYNKMPTQAALQVEIDKRQGLTEETAKKLARLIPECFAAIPPDDFDWLIKTTEGYCQEEALYGAIRESIEIIDGNNKKQTLTKLAIPKLLQDALSVSFDTSIGHDFLEDAELRYDIYHSAEERIPFDIKLMNKITKGGIPKKTLIILQAGTNVGKTAHLCHYAANNLMMGKNVLFVTMEMAEERIAERIDQNLLDMDQDQLGMLTRERYLKKLTDLKKKITGKLIIKEYPTGSASAANIRYLIEELKIKKNFVPDVLYVDYLNICASSRYKQVQDSYGYIKAISEEIRGLGVEKNLAVISAIQNNRGGNNVSDFELNDMADSFGIAMTADLVLGIIETPDMAEMGQQRIKQLKSRFNSKTKIKSFLVGIDKNKMKLYDINNQTFDDDGGYSKFSQTPTNERLPWASEDDDEEADGVIDIMNIKPVMKEGFDSEKPFSGLKTEGWKL